MYNLSYNDKNIPYQVTYSSRKSIGISVAPKEGVVIKAPRGIRSEELEKIIEQKAKWIYTKYTQLQEIEKQRPKTTLTDGSSISYRGVKYPIQIIEVYGSNSICIKFQKDRFLIHTGSTQYEHLKYAFEQFFREQAKRIIANRTAYYAQSMKETYGRICIKEQKSRWGSCSSKRNLNFNWKLIMAPPEILDYVVVHELCHLRYMDHSADFWTWVEVNCPDYRCSRKWLNENGNQLGLD